MEKRAQTHLRTLSTKCVHKSLYKHSDNINVLMDTATQVQILDQANCISHSTNTLGKGMDPIILPPAMGK